MYTIEKTIYIDIDIDYIIEKYQLNSNSDWDAIMLAVRKYIFNRDDDIYDLVDNDKDKEHIAEIIAEILTKEE